MTEETVTSDNLITEEPVTPEDNSWQARYLPDDLKENATLQKFKDVGGLSSSYLSMQEMLGSRVKVPTEESSDEERSDFYNKLGRPEAPDKYELQIDERFSQNPSDQQKIQEFREQAFKQGFTNTQAQKAVDFYTDMINGSIIDQDAVMGQARITAETALKKEWGPTQYDKNLALSRRAFNRFADDDLKKFVNENGISNNIGMIKFLHKIGTAFNEPEMAGMGKDSGSVDSDSARIEIDAMMKDSKHKYHEALFDPKDVKHEEAINYRDHLYDVVYRGEE
jgi:hypothetical protein